MTFSEEQIKSLSDHIMIHMTPVVEAVMDRKFNGKMDSLMKNHNEFVATQMDTNQRQDKLLESLSKGQMLQVEATDKIIKQVNDLKTDVQDVVQLYKGGTTFLSSLKKSALFTAAISAGLAGVIYLRDKLLS